MHVHASSISANFVPTLHPAGRPPTRVLGTLGTGTGVAARLIERALGAEACRPYRTSERIYPLYYRSLYFPVSHATGLTVEPIPTTPIGVDAERRLRKADAADMTWSLSADKSAELPAHEPPRLTEIWTAKEASGARSRAGRRSESDLLPSSAWQAGARVRVDFGVPVRRSSDWRHMATTVIVLSAPSQSES